MKNILILLLVAAILLVTSGCTQSAPEAPPTPVVTTTKAPSPTYLPMTATPTLEKIVSVNDNSIMIRKAGFSPSAITVKKGATVRWVNVDSTEDPALYNPTHRIRIVNVKDGQTMSSGEGWSWVFTNTGVYRYSDMIHTDLQGTVTVE
jgi:plastocyanin